MHTPSLTITLDSLLSPGNSVHRSLISQHIYMRVILLLSRWKSRRRDLKKKGDIWGGMWCLPPVGDITRRGCPLCLSQPRLSPPASRCFKTVLHLRLHMKLESVESLNTVMVCFLHGFCGSCYTCCIHGLLELHTHTHVCTSYITGLLFPF